jgi:hypothetical protein
MGSFTEMYAQVVMSVVRHSLNKEPSEMRTVKAVCGKLVAPLLVVGLFLFLPGGAQGELVVSAGWDLLRTREGTQFMGVPFEGVPLGTFDFGSGPVSVGTTDTIVHRLEDAVGFPPVLPGPADAPAVALEMAALQLITAVPADFGAGLGYYYVTLQSARGGPPSMGSMAVHFNGDHVAPPEEAVGTGTFSSSLLVNFDLRYGALNGPIVLSDSLPLTASGAGWDHQPAVGTLLIDGINHLLRDGVYPHQDFFSDPFSEIHPFGQHNVETTPEPCTLALLAVAGLCLASWACQRKRRG